MTSYVVNIAQFYGQSADDYTAGYTYWKIWLNISGFESFDEMHKRYMSTISTIICSKHMVEI